MRLSFMTINRFVEARAVSDEGYGRALQQQGKALLAHGRALSDEALLAKLHALNLALDKKQFLTLAQPFFSTEEMACAVYRGPCRDIDERMKDWVWITFTCLWERWQPDRPSVEMIDDLMQEGYQTLKRGDAPGACRVWLAAWKGIRNILEALPIRSVREFDDRF